MKHIKAKYDGHARDREEADQPPLVYHTFFSEYKADTPEGIIALMHADSKQGTGISMSEWWAYQKELWSLKYGLDVPSQDAPDAAAAMIGILLSVGALEEGPKSPQDNQPTPGLSNG